MKNMKKSISFLLTLCLVFSLCGTLTLGAFAASYAEDDVWTINVHTYGGSDVVTVTRLEGAITTSLSGITYSGASYEISDAMSGTVMYDDYNNVRQASFAITVTDAGDVAVNEDTLDITIVIDGVSTTHSRADFATYLTTTALTYSGTTLDGVSYHGITTEYLTIKNLLGFLGVSEASLESMSFRPADWDNNPAYVRTLDAAAALSAVLSVKGYQNADQSRVNAGMADSLNALRLIPGDNNVNAFQSVKWVNYIEITTTPGGNQGGSGNPGGVTPPVMLEPPVDEDPKDDEYAGYIDVADGAWYYDAIKFASENELMNGTGNNMFSPNGNVTRAMVVTILYRLEGEPSDFGTSPFADVAAGAWYTNAVIWAAENEIVKGYGNDLFGPNDSITREQIAAILMRYVTWKGLEASERADISGFADHASISDWALDAVRWANAEGLMTGRTAETLAPKGNATRAETAMLMQRLIDILD